MRSRSYVIVTWPEGGRPVQVPRHRAGRHRTGSPGRVRPQPGGTRRPYGRGRHRRPEKPSVLAARYGTLTALLSMVTVSGWFAVSGAAAFAQMIQP